MRSLARLLAWPALFLALFSGSGCGILIGNVKPVDEKSESYGVLDLAKVDPDWVRLNSQQQAPDAQDPDVTATEVADVAFQSQRTASIISLNSACRKHMEEPEQNLHTLTNLLFLGLTDVTLRKETPTTVQNTPALESEVEGKLNGEAMRFKTVVLRRGTCIYDLIYMARPNHFQDQEQVFSRFVASLRLK